MTDNQIAEQLRRILALHGRAVVNDAARLEALLRDHCGEHRRQISALLSAVREGIPADLTALSVSLPPGVVFSNLARRLSENQGLAEDLAKWSVGSWAFALGASSLREPNRNEGMQWSPQSTAVHEAPADLRPRAIAAFGATQYVSEGASTAQYASFWIRSLAHIIDIVLLESVTVIVALLTRAVTFSGDDSREMPIFLLIFGVAGWLYSAATESSSKQATLGKMALHLRVTDLNGKRLSFGRATARYVVKIFFGDFLMAGFLIACFTSRKQALHDLIAGTLVTRNRRQNESVQQPTKASTHSDAERDASPGTAR